MTTTQLILVASIGGAILFFAAGAALMALRHRDDEEPLAATDPRDGHIAELAQLRYQLEGAQATVKSQTLVIEEQNRLFERDVTNDRAAVARDMQALRERADRAEAAARDAKHKRDDEAAKLRTEAERQRTEAERLRTETDRLRTESDRLRVDVERLQKEAQAAAATNQQLRKIADDRAKLLERTKNESVATTTDMAQLDSKLHDIERQLADKTASVRDLSTENEQLKGRLRDADALRAEYVRLRTATTDSDYLKTEIARLEKELRRARVDALGAPQKPRPARGTDRQNTAAERPISESLAMVIEKFADAGTRSSALGDSQGFPLASTGTDGVALAAYAALLVESASRAKEYLPVGTPSAIEIVDANGVRVSVWSLEVETERLMFANLAVSPVDLKRVESTLGDLSRILAPSTTHREQRTG